MPIRKELRKFYTSAEWAAARARVLKRAGGKCERCKKPLGRAVFTYRGAQVLASAPSRMYWSDGRQNAKGQAIWFDQHGDPLTSIYAHVRGLPACIRVQIHAAHREHVAGGDPRFFDDDNLIALCNWCHFWMDTEHHHATRGARKDRARPLLAEARAV